jgi:transmembrane sensor
MIVLSPGQQAELDGMTRRLTVKPAEPGIEGWHDTAFDLNQTDIRTLCKILERAYNVKIIIAPDVDIERTYSGPLKKKENVAATLDLIKNSIGIKYKVIGENVFISSSKSK